MNSTKAPVLGVSALRINFTERGKALTHAEGAKLKSQKTINNEKAGRISENGKKTDV